jgi:lipopolysaccharide biosynthesis regulator YciM
MDYWLLLLILSAILIGWILGRWDPFVKNSSSNSTGIFSDSYVKGLNYLLSNDSNKAIGIFTELIEVNSDTIEIHITLGNLFRSKGEVERAIKVHQNLLARPNLSKKQRNMAIAELANDYLKAGLLDRAEKLFKEMIQLKTDDLVAYRRLLDLYITEKSWHEAIGCAQILYDRGETDATIIYSQCLCEVAENAMSQGKNKVARESLAKAIEVDQNCVRATLLLIKLHLDSNSIPAAQKLFKRLIKLKPEYMGLYIEPAKKIYLRGKKSGAYQNFLQQQYLDHPSTRLAMALLEYYVDQNQVKKARLFLSDVLKSSPSFESFEFALRFLRSDPDHLSETWESLSSFLKMMHSKKIEFTCSQCGYESHVIEWNCPSCKSWASMKPI